MKKTIQQFYSPCLKSIEIGIDEVGRGPLFGRVYTSAVILPKDDSFNHFNMKDSKRFHSKKKIQDMSNYIKANSIAWSISWEDEKVIDKINILQATQQSMHKCIQDILKTHENLLQTKETYKLIIDGNYFKAYYYYNFSKKRIEQLPHECIVGGDDKYSAIAAASILAKVARDKYIEDLCEEFPYLDDNYSLLSNKGYGTKKHMDGIREHGVTEWHRHSFSLPLPLFPKVEVDDYTCSMSHDCPINSNCASLSPECKKYSSSYAPFL